MKILSIANEKICIFSKKERLDLQKWFSGKSYFSKVGLSKIRELLMPKKEPASEPDDNIDSAYHVVNDDVLKFITSLINTKPDTITPPKSLRQQDLIKLPALTLPALDKKYYKKFLGKATDAQTKIDLINLLLDCYNKNDNNTDDAKKICTKILLNDKKLRENEKLAGLKEQLRS